MPQLLDAPLSEVPGLPARFVKTLAKEGVKTVGDVLWWLPFRHEDRRRLSSGTIHASDTPVCHQVRVVKTGRKFFGRRGSGLFEAQTEPAAATALGQTLALRWWGMPFMSRAIAEGQELIVYGRIKEFKGRLFMDHPEYEVLKDNEEDDSATIHTGRITPIYRLKAGLTQKAL